MAITSKEINLAQLDKELGGQGLIANFEDPENKLIKPADNSTITEAKLKAAIDAHVAIDENAAKEAAKKEILDRIGLTADELKTILG